MKIEQVTLGDEVWLRTGGPAMVVVNVGNTRVECGWFDESCLYHTSHMPPAALMHENEVEEQEAKKKLKRAPLRFDSITLKGGE